MPVFKAYFKVTKKNLPTLLIYVAVFTFMTIVFSSVWGGQSTGDYSSTKTAIIIRQEEKTPLTEGLVTYLSANTVIVQPGAGENSVKDALFYNKAAYVLTIPVGFTENFVHDKNDVTLEKMASAQAQSTVSVDMLVNKYLDLAQLYITNMPSLPQETVAQRVLQDLKISADIQLQAANVQKQTDNVVLTFHYMAYGIMAVMILGVVTMLMAFNEPEVARRNQCAPLRPSAISAQLIAGNTVFMLVVWLMLCVLAMVLSRHVKLDGTMVLLCLNALTFAISCLGLAFFIGKFIRSSLVLSAVGNVVTLGESFLCGIFVPQEILSPTVLKIASFTPAFWYIRGVDAVKNMSGYSAASLRPLLEDIAIQLAFGIVFLILALVVSKQRRKSTDSAGG